MVPFNIQHCFTGAISLELHLNPAQQTQERICPNCDRFGFKKDVSREKIHHYHCVTSAWCIYLPRRNTPACMESRLQETLPRSSEALNRTLSATSPQRQAPRRSLWFGLTLRSAFTLPADDPMHCGSLKDQLIVFVLAVVCQILAQMSSSDDRLPDHAAARPGLRHQPQLQLRNKNMSPVVMSISGSDHYCGHVLMPGLRSSEAS